MAERQMKLNVEDGSVTASEPALGSETALHRAGTTLSPEALPRLLRMFSAGDLSFIASGSPESSVDAGTDMSIQGSENAGRSTHDQTLSRSGASQEGLDASPTNQTLPASPTDGCTAVDISKLMDDDKTTGHSTGLLTPKSVLPKARGSMTPSPPHRVQGELSKKVSFNNNQSPNSDASKPQSQPYVPLKTRMLGAKRKFYSQPMPAVAKHSTATNGRDYTHSGPVRRCASQTLEGGKSERYVIFRTKSNRFDKSYGRSNSKQQQDERDSSTVQSKKGDENRPVPAGRYFDALKGPELEILKESEELLLPLDERWPFLLRFPIGCFGICLGLSSQAILWKALSTSPSMSFLHIPLTVNLVLWCLGLLSLVCVFAVYALKCLLYFEAVRREYYHPVRVNFFFAPWIACMFLAIGIPPRIATTVSPVLWCIFMAPIFMLELKIYGQWLSGGERRLSKVANPSTHLSLVGNFVGALLAAIVGWKEPAVFFWAVGCAHYLVLFVTLYQRLPTAEALPKELHPVFFLFVAAPSAASVAWKFIVGDFDHVSRTAYFIALFLYSSLVVRINFFRGFQFSIAWWAYTFPMTASAIATIHYSLEIRHPITQVLAVMLSVISAATVFTLFVSTILHGVLWDSLFPNDIAIAITNRRHKRRHKGKHLDGSSSLGTADSLNKVDGHMNGTGYYLNNGNGPPQKVLNTAESDPLPLKEMVHYKKV